MGDISESDQLWGIPVVLYCVWTVVLLVSSLVVLSCLGRETKKFHKKLSKADNKDELVSDTRTLESLMARYVRQFLGQGLLDKLSNCVAAKTEPSQADKIRTEIKEWFTMRAKDLEAMNYTEKSIKRIILAAIRTGLTRHPLDLRGSRRALEAAKIFMSVDTKAERISFLNSRLVLRGAEKGESEGGGCPTYPCQWITQAVLNTVSCIFSNPNTIPALSVLLSFTAWIYDIFTDAVIIQTLWDFKLPIMYPVNETRLESDVTYLSYQTLTIDLYAPLLLLLLLFSLLYTLLSCSCSRLSDRYRLASRYNRPSSELSSEQEDPNAVLARYEFQISSAVTSSLSQFCVQFGSHMLILYMLETLARLSVDQGTRETVQAKIDEFRFSSLWLSGVGSGVSLCTAQYSAYKIQHEHDTTLAQRVVYFLACVFNTIAMLTSCLMFLTVIVLPVSEYVGRYHLMILVIILAAIMGVSLLVTIILTMFGMDLTKITTDKVLTVGANDNVLTALLRFSQVGKGKWAVILGSINVIGKLYSLVTINLFLPPSQLLVHPFSKYYANSPRSPALHYAIAKQLTCYNILMVITAILLAVDINVYNFNYNLSFATKNLMVASNLFCVPCIFLSLLILFKFYSTHDIWTSNGVHLVFQPDPNVDLDNLEAGKTETGDTVFEQTNVTEIEDSTLTADNDESIGNLIPVAESTIVSNGDTNSNSEENNESTEADRNHIETKKKKIKIIKTQTSRLNQKMKTSCCSFVVDAADIVVGGKWVNVSD